jgi:DeoR/GlpR family transcriptional regulator of sugar metabolism
MFQVERQEKILEYINNKKKAKVIELSKVFKTSSVTIRSDINELTKKGLVVKTHGGVLSIEGRLNLEIPYYSKFQSNIEKKRIIGKTAAEIVEDNDVIILDAGSTTLEVAKNLCHKNVTLITNDIRIGMEIANEPKVNLIMTGGKLERSVYTLLGDETISFLSRINVNKLFLGCDAYSRRSGISNRTLSEVAVKKAMIAASMEIILVTDSTKIGKTVFAKLCGPFEIDKIVIDKMSEDDIDYLSQNGVQVILAQDSQIDSTEG